MAETYKHARSISPYFIPQGIGNADDFHGLTDAGGNPTIGKTDEFIIGQKDKCGTRKDIPEVTVPLTQNERGEINTFLTLANLTAMPSGGFTLSDFTAAIVDTVYYVREEERGTIEASIWHPQTTMSSFSLSIDADDKIVREIELTGENEHVLAGTNNKYLIWTRDTAPSGTSGNYTITVNDPAPSVNPNVSGEYILNIYRTRSGTRSILDVTTDYTFDGVDEITILSAETDDVYDIYYSASSFGSGGDPTTVDSDTNCFLKSENVTVELNDGTTTVELDGVTSLSLDATLTRLNEATVGTTTKIKEITETPVTLSTTLRPTADFFHEKAFMNTLSSSDLVSDLLTFKDNIKVTIKIYETSSKSNFLIGYQLSNLSLDDSTLTITANEFAEQTISASTTDILITNQIGDL